MNREEYRRAFDQIPFSEDFQARTAALLRARARELEQEESKMTFRKTRKMIVCAAAAVAVLALSVSAAVLWLSPQEVAEEIEDPLLAQAFAGEDAVLLDETAQAGDYTVTLGGLVSGAGISDWFAGAEEDRTYAVVSVARTDGTPLTEDNYDVSASGTFTITPLVSGYAPQAVNVFTLNGACTSFLRDGRAYYVLNTWSLEMFADHTVYLALYEGFAAPSYSRFSVAEDGTVSMREGVVGCMFTLPLDASKADPEAARAFVESRDGIPWEPLTDEELAALEAETAQEEPAEITVPGTYGGVEVIEVPGHGLVTAMQAQAAAEYEAFMDREAARLERELEAGTLSEEAYAEAVQEMETSLAGLWDGTRAPTWRLGEGGTGALETQPSPAALAEQAEQAD